MTTLAEIRAALKDEHRGFHPCGATRVGRYAYNCPVVALVREDERLRSALLQIAKSDESDLLLYAHFAESTALAALAADPR